jgi:hypothetical protein
MRPILTPFELPIKALALDPVRNHLAVGCGGDTFIFSRPLYGGLESWDFLDHVSAPSEGHEGLVTSLGFCTKSKPQSQLFIGHAKAGYWSVLPTIQPQRANDLILIGYSVWRGPRNHQQTAYGSNDAVCSM